MEKKDYDNIILAFLVLLFSVTTTLIFNEVGRKNKLKRMEFERSYKIAPTEKELHKIENDTICRSLD